MNWGKYILMSVCLFMVLILCGCTGNTQGLENDSAYPEYDPQSAFLVRLDDLNTVYKQGEHYRILSDENQYAFEYWIYDDNGYFMDNGYHGLRGRLDIIEEGELVILERSWGGTNVGNHKRYCNPSTGQVSRFFNRPAGNTDELVAYFDLLADGEIVLIVQNIFDPNVYYKEIRGDFTDFVIKDDSYALFLEGDSKLEITYPHEVYANGVSKLVNITEVFELAEQTGFSERSAHLNAKK